MCEITRGTKRENAASKNNTREACNFDYIKVMTDGITRQEVAVTPQKRC